MKKIIIVFSLLFSINLLSFAQLNGNGFYRLRNGNATDEYIKIYHDSINAQDIVGSASSVYNDEGEAAMLKVAAYLDVDIKTIKASEIFTDPGTVIYLEKQSGSSSNYDILGQGVGLKYISTCIFYGTNAGALPIKGMPATITSVGDDLYTAHVTLKRTVRYIFFTKTITQTRYIGDDNSKVSLSKTVDDNKYKWYIEPINLTNNYFAAAPLANLTQNNKYYTSLRTSFSYTVPNNSSVKVYKVTGLPSIEGELATCEEIPQGTVTPSGYPVIIESSSLSTSDNMLMPCTPIAYLEANYSATDFESVNSTSITPKNLNHSNVLFSNYGYHGHDVYRDNNEHTGTQWNGWLQTGDNLGFFTSPYYDSKGNRTVHTYYGSQTIYRLGIKDGAVGFWDKVEKTDEVSGNEAYSPVPCQLFPVEKELADIAEDGAVDISYDIVEVDHDHYLYGVKAVDGKLYAKDYGKFRNPNIKSEDAIDGMGKFYDYNKPYDQSNWVALTGLDNPGQYEGQNLHVVGKLINRANPEIKVSKINAFPTSESYNESEYNHYCPANFMSETQTGSTNGKTYFFVKPKPQEVVHIVGAIYGGENKFYINEPDSYYNTVHLKGGFMIDPSCPYSYTVGTAYEFNAVVKKAEPSSASLNVLPYLDGGVSNEYVVYPFSQGVPTGVQNLDVDAQIVSVKYYNTMGIESAEPFKGVNIVVTTYDNGTRTTSKVIK